MQCQLVRCQEPLQRDPWSCGVRTILAARECAKCLLKRQPFPEKLPGGFYSDVRLRWLIASMQQADHPAAIIATPSQSLKRTQAAEQEMMTPPNPTSAESRISNTLKRKQATTSDELVCKRPKLEKDWLQAGAERAKGGGIDFHKIFQAKHFELHCWLEAGHWRKWLLFLVNQGPRPVCKACDSLFAELEAAEDAKKVAMASGNEKKEDLSASHPDESGGSNEAESATEIGQLQKHRGRPKGSTTPHFSLKAWISENRSGRWQLISDRPESKYPARCQGCNRLLLLQRNNLRRLLDHEKTCGKGTSSDPSATESSQQCRGLRVDSPACALSPITATVRKWRNAGMPHGKEFDKPLLSKLAWQEDGEVLWMRSSTCKGESAGNAASCKDCLAAGGKAALRQEVALWGFRIDCFEYASSLLHGTEEEQQELRRQILEADYSTLKLPGCTPSEMFTWSDVDQVWRVRHMLLSFPVCKRTPSLQNWLRMVDKQLALRVHSDDVSCWAAFIFYIFQYFS